MRRRRPGEDRASLPSHASGCHHRWRHHRLLDRLPPDEARREGCAAPRAQTAHERHDLARGGSGARDALHAEPHAAREIHGRSLWPAGGPRPARRPGFVQPGSISIATNAERWEELLRGAGMVQSFGVEAEPISAREAQQKWPLMNVDDVVGAVWYPRDGKCNPIDTCMALARGRAAWAGHRSSRTWRSRKCWSSTAGRSASTTSEGDGARETVVNCAGIWARDVDSGRLVSTPLKLCEHFYIVTDPMGAGCTPTCPVMRDMDHCAYFKEDAGKLLLGAFEPRRQAVGASTGFPRISRSASCRRISQHFAPILEDAMRRVPSLRDVGIRKFFNGPESFSADGRYHPARRRSSTATSCAAGFNSIGIQLGGGAGMALADWIVNGEPPFDLWDVDIAPLLAAPEREELPRATAFRVARPPLRDALAVPAVRERRAASASRRCTIGCGCEAPASARCAGLR